MNLALALLIIKNVKDHLFNVAYDQFMEQVQNPYHLKAVCDFIFYLSLMILSISKLSLSGS